MKIVQKGNRQIRVADDRLNSFLDAGYLEVDPKTGKTIAKEPADELKALKKENAQLKKVNKELADKVEELTAKLALSTTDIGSAAQ